MSNNIDQNRVIYLDAAIRARLSQLCDEHMAMQEALPNVASIHVVAHLDAMQALAERMSGLAARISDNVPTVPIVPDVPTVSER